MRNNNAPRRLRTRIGTTNNSAQIFFGCVVTHDVHLPSAHWYTRFSSVAMKNIVAEAMAPCRVPATRLVASSPLVARNTQCVGEPLTVKSCTIVALAPAAYVHTTTLTKRGKDEHEQAEFSSSMHWAYVYIHAAEPCDSSKNHHVRPKTHQDLR